MKIITYLLILTGLTVVIVMFIGDSKSAIGSLDEFAQCLTDKGAVMYGADWCPHCKNERKAFGDSFRLINYVECPDNPNLCIEKGINGYPTWIFHDSSDGPDKKLEGKQGLLRLSRESGCVLPDNQ